MFDRQGRKSRIQFVLSIIRVYIDDVVLAEYTESTGNFPSIARFLLRKINKSLSKQSYTYDVYCFHFLICEPGVTFMAMTDRSFGLTIPYEYLLDIRSKTLPFVEMLASPISLILNGVVSPIIKERMVSVVGLA